MKHTIVAFLSALLFLAFTPSNALADDHHRHHRHHDRDRDWDRDHDRYGYHRWDHDRGYRYGYYYEHRRRSEYREAHWAWINHHRVWVPARTIVIYF